MNDGGQDNGRGSLTVNPKLSDALFSCVSLKAERSQKVGNFGRNQHKSVYNVISCQRKTFYDEL